MHPKGGCIKVDVCGDLNLHYSSMMFHDMYPLVLNWIRILIHLKSFIGGIRWWHCTASLPIAVATVLAKLRRSCATSSMAKAAASAVLKPHCSSSSLASSIGLSRSSASPVHWDWKKCGSDDIWFIWWMLIACPDEWKEMFAWFALMSCPRLIYRAPLHFCSCQGASAPRTLAACLPGGSAPPGGSFPRDRPVAPAKHEARDKASVSLKRHSKKAHCNAVFLGNQTLKLL